MGESAYAGVDIGSTTSKAVILVGEEIKGQVLGPSTTNPTKTAREVFEKALAAAKVPEKDVAYIVGTGYGRAKVVFAGDNISEISCHGKGAFFLLPSVRTVIDLGGQDTKAIRLDEQGNLLDFGMNDKCAAGTGRFLDFMARSMELSVESMSELHFKAAQAAVISNMCSVFAESEVINLINEEVPIPSIVKGLHQSVANRINTLVQRVGLQEDAVITGGVAKNKGVVAAVQEKLGVALKEIPHGFDPQLIGALGAAVFARERALRKK